MIVHLCLYLKLFIRYYKNDALNYQMWQPRGIDQWLEDWKSPMDTQIQSPQAVARGFALGHVAQLVLEGKT